jgi:hypothetical protein
MDLIVAAGLGIAMAILLFIRDQVKGSVIRRKRYLPFANHQKVGEMQPAEQNIVVVNPPAATDHDENGRRIDPMHDP